MDEPGGHETEWITKGQILYGSTYTENLKQLNSQKQRVEWWLPEAGVWGKWEIATQWVKSFNYI